MSKKLRTKPFPLPPRTGISGTAFDIKCFPDSAAGKTAPFNVPPKPTPVADFPTNFHNWLDYYVNLVGAKMEFLNGLQFNLDLKPKNAKAMSKELGTLADALKLGSGNSPAQLIWPLNVPNVPYTFAWSPNDAQFIGFGSFVIDLNFEVDPDFQMVVNCSVAVTATSLAPSKPISSSSSYLATSSSSH